MIFDVYLKTPAGRELIVRVSDPSRKHALSVAKRSAAGRGVIGAEVVRAERVPYVRRRVVSQCLLAPKPSLGRVARVMLTLECGHKPKRMATARSAMSAMVGDVKIEDRRVISCVPCTLALRPIQLLNQEEE